MLQRSDSNGSVLEYESGVNGEGTSFFEFGQQFLSVLPTKSEELRLLEQAALLRPTSGLLYHGVSRSTWFEVLSE